MPGKQCEAGGVGDASEGRGVARREADQDRTAALPSALC